MRKHYILFTLLLFIITTSFSFVSTQAKKSSIVKKVYDPNWILALETNTELEVFYSLDVCDDQKKLLLKYFNEMPFGQNIKYNIKLKYAGYIIEQEKTKSVTPNQIISADCTTSDTSMYIKLPPQWEFDRVTVTADLVEVSQQNN